tara:strand:+ start:1707 stop:2198 length:492 start_codon:yes stop_codon:yes gene_type:complete
VFDRKFIIPVLWLVVSVAAAIFAGRMAFLDPLQFDNAVDMLATIVSILTGVSLAVIAVLVSPFSVSLHSAKDEFETERINKVVQKDEVLLATGQVLFFLVFLFSLVLALLFSWLFDPDLDEVSDAIRWLAAITAFVGIFALLWSARLPFLLASISKRRNSLGG